MQITVERMKRLVIEISSSMCGDDVIVSTIHEIQFNDSVFMRACSNTLWVLSTTFNSLLSFTKCKYCCGILPRCAMKINRSHIFFIFIIYQQSLLHLEQYFWFCFNSIFVFCSFVSLLRLLFPHNASE